MELDFTEIFVYVDDFCVGFIPFWNKKLLECCKQKRKRGPKISLGEILCILIMYHNSPFNCFKNYYNYLFLKQRSDFKYLPSYERFIALMNRALPVLCHLFQCIKGESMGVQFIDSTTLIACKVPRASRNKTFKGIAAKGKTTMGWFFGMKLHMIINHKGEIMEIRVTAGNTDDRKPVTDMVNGLYGKLYGDRGYISSKLTRELHEKDVHLITRLKKNMKNILMTMQDKLLLFKRVMIETIFSKLKLFDKIWHTRHRSVDNAFTHMMASIIAYQLSPNKTSIASFLHFPYP
jgi:hypothetical protein